VANRAPAWVATLTAGLAGIPLTSVFGFSSGLVMAILLGCAAGLLTVPLSTRPAQPHTPESARW
jgi:hypothetical protein